MEHILSIIMILVAAAIMFHNLIKAKELRILTPFIPEKIRPSIVRALRLHRGLMLFFFLAYCLVAAAFFFHISLFGELMVGAVFLFGAFFVLIGVRTQTRMLSEVKNTLTGLLPICSSCKKIRTSQGDPYDPASWTSVEKYISTKTDADFTHSICPDCLKRLYPELYQ